jgi:putative membrane protein insertion efficiency factor
MKQLLQFGLRMYQRWLSPMLPHSCRFVPTCSQYAIDAIDRHGALRGSWLAIGRLLRCHPFARAGYDPVPPGLSRTGTSEEVFRAARKSSSHAF